MRHLTGGEHLETTFHRYRTEIVKGKNPHLLPALRAHALVLDEPGVDALGVVGVVAREDLERGQKKLI